MYNNHRQSKLDTLAAAAAAADKSSYSFLYF
jgi:hypothetical protein